MTTDRSPTPLGAGLRSLILPGWGQISLDHRRFGWSLVATTALTLTAVLTLVSQLGAVETAALLADASVLGALIAVNWVVAGLRLTLAGYAWRARGGRNPLAVTLLAVLVIAPHALLGWFGLETRNALTEVFSQDTTVGSAPQPPALLPPPTSSTSSTTTTSIALTPVTTAPGQYMTDVTVPPTTTTTLPLDGERMNLLLLGGDAGPGRGGLRTDAMILASLDFRSGDAALFGIPRNFHGFTFSDGTPYSGSILNSVYSWGRRNPGVFGGIDPGASAAMDVIGHITGLQVHHFMLIDLTGFASLVDALGGVEITVPRSVNGPLYDTRTGGYEMIHIPAGRQRLSGEEALAYSRARYGTSDYARMARQRCVLTSLVAQSDAFTLLTNYGDILRAFESHVTTDLPLESMPDLIRFLPRFDSDEIEVLGFDSTWSTGRTWSGDPIPDIERIRQAVSETLGETGEGGGSGAAPASEACSAS